MVLCEEGSQFVVWSVLYWDVLYEVQQYWVTFSVLCLMLCIVKEMFFYVFILLRQVLTILQNIREKIFQDLNHIAIEIWVCYEDILFTPLRDGAVESFLWEVSGFRISSIFELQEMHELYEKPTCVELIQVIKKFSKFYKEYPIFTCLRYSLYQYRYSCLRSLTLLVTYALLRLWTPLERKKHKTNWLRNCFTLQLITYDVIYNLSSNKNMGGI